MACLGDFNGCDWFMEVITGKPLTFNTCLLLFFQNLLMYKCKANILEFHSASERLSGGIQHLLILAVMGKGIQSPALIPCRHLCKLLLEQSI